MSEHVCGNMGCETASWKVLDWIIWRTKSQTDSYRPCVLCQRIVVNFVATDSLQACWKETLISKRIPFPLDSLFLSGWASSMEGNSPCVSEWECVFIMCSHVTQAIARTHTHAQTMHAHSLPTWLLGETTPVGVLCFHNDSKDDLESAEKGAEWERGKCKKIEIRQSVCS